MKPVSYNEKERILMRALAKAKPLSFKDEFSGSAAAPFVGRFGYPKVNVGILAPPMHDENVKRFDSPTLWSKSKYSIQEIVELRTAMIHSSKESNIHSPNKIVSIAQEIAMADKSIDVDISLEKKPILNISTSKWTAPTGPKGKVKSINITANPSIPTRVQRFFDDHDTLASEAVTELYSHNIDETSLSRMLSVGIFGKKRKLVPTRWSITATDDTIGKHLINEVKNQKIGECEVYSASYLGNTYIIMFFDEKWSYELFEMYLKPKELEYSTDYEPFEGRKTYAENCAGGYYTVRLAIAEHLKKAKHQSGALVLRFISDEYFIPLGVWVTREASRLALENKPIRFASKELMLNYVELWCKKRLNVDVEHVFKKSNILKNQKSSLQNWMI